MSRQAGIEIDGRRIEAAWWGPAPGAAPTLVLLHEGLGSVGLWRDFPAALAEATGCGVFAYSRFGYGRSDTTALPRPLSYMHDEARAVLPRVLEAAGIRSCVLVGHSDGASIAAIYAGSAADARLRGLALIAPHFFVEDINIAAIAAIGETYERGDLRARLARHHDDVEAAFHGWHDAWLDPGFRAWNITAFLPRIAAPMLVIQGRLDPYGTEAQVEAAERLAGGPVRSAWIETARHAPHVEAPGETVAAVAGFARAVLEEARD